MRRYLVSVGGLGNQLFIWNAAHYLVEEGNKVTILIQTSSDRKFELSDPKEVCSHDIKLKEADLFFRILRILDLLTWKIPLLKNVFLALGMIIYNHPSDPISKNSKRIFFHRGYFQSLEMVETLNSVVLNELLEVANKNLISFKARNQVPDSYQAFHIRRGDLTQNLESIGVLNDKFYKELRSDLPLVITTEKMSDLSDDFDAFAILSEENSSNWESFALLCFADKLVMANSTFSWWAGMVLKFRNKNCEVFQPDKYYKNASNQDFLLVKEFVQVRAKFL